MSFVDNDPPKHLSVGELTNNESISIYSITKGEKRHKYVVAFDMDEISALIKHEGKMPSTVYTNSKKEYKEALEKQNRARKYIEDDKLKSEDNSHSL